MRIEGAIFDLDGTLLDSMPIWDTVGEDYLFALGLTPHENLTETFKNMSLVQAANYYKTEYGITKTVDEIIAGINTIIEAFYIHTAPLKDGVKEFLASLSEKGIKICIATVTDKYLADAALSRCGVREYFSEIFTCNDVGYGKDEPMIYECALKHLGTKKRNTSVFEDAIHGIETAKKAGFIVVGVYDKSEERQEMVQAMSDYYITDFRKMEEIIL